MVITQELKNPQNRTNSIRYVACEFVYAERFLQPHEVIYLIIAK